MEPGAENVYLKQAGTGAAWMGPGSSFDPVKFAQYAGALKQGQEAAKKANDDKEQAAFWTKLKLTPGNILKEDYEAFNNVQHDLTQWGIEETQKAQQNGTTPNWNNINSKAQQVVGDAQANILRLNTREAEVKDFNNIIQGDSGEKYDQDAMTKNMGIYIKPEKFMNDPQYGKFIQETWVPMYEEAMKDPMNARNPQRTAAKTSLDWSDQYAGKLGLLSPIHNDASLMDDYRENVLPLVKENNKTHVGKTDSQGNTITEDYAYTLPYDTEVKTNQLDEQGNPVTITLMGTRSALLKRYGDNQIIARSANNKFSKQGEDIQKEYIDQYGRDAAKNWYADDLSGLGLTANSSKITKKDQTNNGGTYVFGNSTFKTNLKLDPFKKNQWTTRKGTVEGGDLVGGNTWTTGIDIKKSNGEALTLDNINAPYYVRSDDKTQNQVPTGSKNMIMEGSTSFKAPTFTANITLPALRTELEKIPYTDNKGKKMTAWDYFKSKFNRYLDAGYESGSLENSILTNDEVTFFQNIGIAGDVIQDKKFTYGTLIYDEPTIEDPNKYTKVKINGAIVPLEYTESSINASLGEDNNIGVMLDAHQADNNYSTWKNPNFKGFGANTTQPNNTNTTVPDPRNDFEKGQ